MESFSSLTADGQKFEYPESMETEDRRGMAKNRGRMRLHSWTDDMGMCSVSAYRMIRSSCGPGGGTDR